MAWDWGGVGIGSDADSFRRRVVLGLKSQAGTWPPTGCPLIFTGLHDCRLVHKMVINPTIVGVRMLNRLFRKPRRRRPEEPEVCCEWCQTQIDGVTERNLSIESRLLEIEANLASEASVGLLKLRIDFAFRLMAQIMPESRGATGAALPAGEFQAETVEAMFDLAGRLIRRVEQVGVPDHREDTGSESTLPP